MFSASDIDIQSTPLPVETGGKKVYRVNILSSINVPGTLYRLTAVFYRHSWDIYRCQLAGDESSINDTFDVYHKEGNPLDGETITILKKEMLDLLGEELTTIEYLARAQVSPPVLFISGSGGSTELSARGDETMKLVVTGSDRKGLLLMLAELFFLLGIDVIAASVDSPGGKVKNEFILRDPGNELFLAPEKQEALEQEIHEIL